MKSNYKKLGDYIRLVDERNKDDKVTRLLGVSIEKKFIESIANAIETLSPLREVTGPYANCPFLTIL